MSKKYYRFFGGLLDAQARWLNKMSARGYRLVRTEKLLYEFEECQPNQVTYCVEFVGQKSREHAEAYRDFLEEMGYKVFYKNIFYLWTLPTPANFLERKLDKEL